MVDAHRRPSRCWRRRRRRRRGSLCRALGSDEVVDVRPARVAPGLVLPAAVLVLRRPVPSSSQSTLITGIPAAMCSATLLGEVAELGITVGVLAALQVILAVGLQAEPHRPQHPPHCPVGHRCPAAVSAPARCRVDFEVHRSGDIGSPRVSGLHQRVQLGQQLRIGTRSASCGPRREPAPAPPAPPTRRAPALPARHRCPDERPSPPRSP